MVSLDHKISDPASGEQNGLHKPPSLLLTIYTGSYSACERDSRLAFHLGHCESEDLQSQQLGLSKRQYMFQYQYIEYVACLDQHKLTKEQRSNCPSSIGKLSDVFQTI